MNDRSRLVLVRHGRTAWNLEGRAQGHTDVPLDSEGHRQAADMAPFIAAMSPVALWSSDLQRARETTSYVAAATGLEAVYDARLREFDVGERSGLTEAEFAARFPQEHAAWVGGHITGGVRGAETQEQVTERVAPLLAKLLAETPAGECTVVVGHGAALRVALVDVVGLPSHAARRMRALENCGWAVLESDPGGPRLASYNETAHSPTHEPDFASDAPSR